MPKLTLKANPTFKVTVKIPIAGDKDATVNIEYKHRRKKELAEFMASRVGKTDLETVMDCVVGWDMDEEFSETAVNELLEINAGAAVALYEKYTNELRGVREGN